MLMFMPLFVQVSVADDSCHPPAALLGKVQETDKLIKAEATETGRVGKSLHT